MSSYYWLLKKVFCVCVETDNFIYKMKEQDEIQHVKDLVVLFLICEYTSILNKPSAPKVCTSANEIHPKSQPSSLKVGGLISISIVVLRKKNQIVFSKRMTSERESKIVPSNSNLLSHQSYVYLILRADIYFRGSWQAYLVEWKNEALELEGHLSRTLIQKFYSIIVVHIPFIQQLTRYFTLH